VKVATLKPQYVDFMPKALEDGVLYISEKYSTAVHKCCCGCGEKVVTPLKPTEWSLSVVKDAVTLSPSIGNWSFPCQSHYWIRNNRVEWSGMMAKSTIERNRRRDQVAKQKHFEQVNAKLVEKPPVSSPLVSMPPVGEALKPVAMWRTLLNWLTSR
jgi:hypothetical protein